MKIFQGAHRPPALTRVGLTRVGTALTRAQFSARSRAEFPPMAQRIPGSWGHAAATTHHGPGTFSAPHALAGATRNENSYSCLDPRHSR
jgi:hypothetical protein